ncbi:MAG: hypothetical protein JWM59_3633 [Verrucomicrobiales bacterium]|nr:hypothetical protein [Verrucomicrobiales bacterium]
MLKIEVGSNHRLHVPPPAPEAHHLLGSTLQSRAKYYGPFLGRGAVRVNLKISFSGISLIWKPLTSCAERIHSKGQTPDIRIPPPPSAKIPQTCGTSPDLVGVYITESRDSFTSPWHHQRCHMPL